MTSSTQPAAGRCQPSPQEPLEEQESRLGVLGLTLAVSILGPLPVYMAGAFAVLVREDLSFDEAGLGLAVSGFFLGSALASIPGGRLAEAVGPFRGMAVGSGLTLTAATCMALLVTSYWQFAACLVIAGFGNAVVQPSGNVAITVGVPLRRQGLAFGIKQAAGPGSALIAGLAVPALALTLGWRWGFGVAALLSFGLTVACIRGGVVRQRDQAGGGRLGRPWTHLVVLCLVAGFGAASLNSVGSFYVSSVVELQGLGEGVAGLGFGLGGLAGVIGRVGAGWFADRMTVARVHLVGLMQAVGGLGIVLLSVGNAHVVLAAATTMAFVAGWGWQGVFNYAVVRHYPQAPAAATAIANTGLFLGGVLGPALFGLMVEMSSYATAWRVAGAWMLTAGGLALYSRRLEPSSTI